MSKIPSEFIDQLIDRLDIVDIISQRITLKKAGRDYQALCPFHTENTPSFTVSQDKQFYHCFGCGKHGTAIGFLMEFEGMDFVDSIETLAQKVGMEVPRQGGFNRSAQGKNLYEIMDNANRFFQNSYQQSEIAQQYLNARGISKEVQNVFQIGYAPDAWDGLLSRYKNQQNELLQGGLIVAKENGKVYDKFRDRLMFPIADRRGRTIAFGGRAIHPEQKPKYLNSPETPLFHKGKELYGYNIARKHSKEKFIIVVEGYMDVIALHQAGFKNAVATLGTATSEYHIISLLRSYDEVVFCFDGDKAGTEAAWKALKTALPVYRDDKNIKFLFLPQEHDPDSYVKAYGSQAFSQELAQAQSYSVFLIQRLSQHVDLHTIDGKAQFIDRAKKFLNALPKGQFQSLVLQEIEQITHSKIDLKLKAKVQNNKNIEKWNPIRKAIAILINNPQMVINLPESLEISEIKQNGSKLLTEIVEYCRYNPNIKTASLVENFRNHEMYEHLCFLATISLGLNCEQLLLELEDIKKYFQKMIQKHKINRLREKKAQHGLSNEEKQQLIQLLSNRIN